MSINRHSRRGPDDDVFGFNLPRAGALAVDLGIGDDVVAVSTTRAVPQVRLTFTSSEVGNDLAADGNTLANQDGRLAVRAQAEDGAGNLVGVVNRFDDEGITFTSSGRATFDVRDLVSGAQRGDGFDVVRLGTRGDDVFSAQGSREANYVNAGQGNDTLTGGRRADFLVGGAGNDTLSGREGDDSFIGGAGDDVISGGTGDDVAILNVATDGADRIDLGTGLDTVNVAAPSGSQVRLTFTSAEVGNNAALDGGALANQDGGLAVRLQAEDGTGALAGVVTRADDEGVSFVSTTGATFDVRDLVSGARRGDQFDVVTLGTRGDDVVDETGEDEDYYVNAGAGNDRLTGGLGRDFLVGGLGRDRLDGGEGDDSLLGGADGDTFVFRGTTGSDRILDFATGTDRIDLRAFGDVDFDNVTATAVGADTRLDVNTDADADAEFQILLVGVAAPAESDFLFA